MYFSTKTYGHELGLSACFRQPLASSHCREPHGYPLSFKLTFAAQALDANNWVIDFGGLKEVKAWLVDNFDHRTLLAFDDPARHDFEMLYEKHGFREPVILQSIGCEAFARFVYDFVTDWLGDNGHAPRVFLHSVEAREHAGNSAIYTNPVVDTVSWR